MSASGDHEISETQSVASGESSRAILRVRRVHGALGPCADQLVVACPFTRLLAPVDQCAACPHAEMLSLDSDGYGSFVICRWPRGAPPRGRG